MNLFLGALAIITLILFFFIIGAVIFWQQHFKKRAIYKNSAEQTTFLVTLPKNYQSNASSTEWTPEKTKAAIALMESFLNSLAGLKVKTKIKNILQGRQDHVSLEIVAQHQEIYFYFLAPKILAEYIKQNLQASIPQAHIEEVKEYNIFQPLGYTKIANIRLARESSLPINTYRQLASDPLNNLTNALAKLEEDEGAVIQVLIRSSHKKWHYISAKIAHDMQSGKTFVASAKEAYRNPLIKLFASFGQAFRSPKKSSPEQMAKKNESPKQLSPQELEMVKAIEEKTRKAGLDVNIHLVASTQSVARSETIINNLSNSFNQFSLYEYGNKFDSTIPKNQNKFIEKFILREFIEPGFILNTEELASVYHFPLPNTETPNISWLKSKKAPAPTNLTTEGIVIGKNIYRGKETLVRIGAEDRRRHHYIIGMTGVGKSALLHEMARQDIQAGRGIGLIDPHGDLAESLLSVIPPQRKKDIIYFNPADIERPIGLNMLEADGIHEQDFAIQEMIMIFYKLVTDPSMIGPMFEHNMRNAMLTLMADKNAPGTITDIPRIFTDPEFQKDRLRHVTDPMVRAFWEKEMAKTSDFHKSEMLGYLISKVGRFIENTMIRNIIGQTGSGFNFKEIMNNQKILIVNLSKGQIGEMNSNLLGLIIVSKLQMAAMSRASLPEEQRKDFFLYIDEFQNYTTDSIATILSEARKYRLNLIMAHQYLGQLTTNNDPKIKDAVLGNVGTITSFRIGVEDAEVMAKQFEPVFNAYDLINVDKFNAFIRTLINNAATKPFNIETIPPQLGEQSQADINKDYSRLTYGRPKEEVERDILKRSRLGIQDSSPNKLIDGDPR